MAATATAVTPVVAMPAAKTEKRRQPKSVSDVISTSFRSATKGGLTGAAAQGVNVGALMWLRTVMNYQMVNGGSMTGTLRLLLKQGGVPRLYRGLVPALFQSPMSRFGDTFANAGALALLEDVNIPIALKTACASVAAGGMRILLMPIDAWKTNKQVHGSQGLKSLTQKARTEGITCFWHGGGAQALATMAGHWPWFVTFNYLDATLGWSRGTQMQRTIRNAFIGINAAFVADVSSNSLRVLKTYRQTSPTKCGYWRAFCAIRAKDGLFGIHGLFFRGLQTRIITHGINSMLFTVVWKAMQGPKAEHAGHH